MAGKAARGEKGGARVARQRRRSRCLRAAAPRRDVAPKRWFARRYPSHEAQVLRGAVLRCVRTGEAPAVRLACAASAHAARTSSTNVSLRLEILASRVRPRWLRCAAPQHAPRPLVQEGVRFLAASRRCSAVLSAAASTSGGHGRSRAPLRCTDDGARHGASSETRAVGTASCAGAPVCEPRAPQD